MKIKTREQKALQEQYKKDKIDKKATLQDVAHELKHGEKVRNQNYRSGWDRKDHQ